MNITYVRKFSFGDVVYNDTANHPHYFTMRFANRPNIDAQIWLTILSPGATYSGGAVTAVGSAAVAIKSYSFLNAQGQVQVVDMSGWTPQVRVEKAVDITFAFHARLAWAQAAGVVFYWE